MNHPLRVMIDARMLIGRFSGISRYVTRLAHHLAKGGDIQVVALCGCEGAAYPAGAGHAAGTAYANGGSCAASTTASTDPATLPTGVEVVHSSFSRSDRSPARRWRWEQAHLGRLIQRAGVDLFHATWNSGIPASCPVPAVLTIHDLIPWSAPTANFAAFRERLCYRRAVRASAQRACAVTVVSEYIRGKVLGTLSLPPEKVRTVFNGVDAPDAAVAAPASIAGPGGKVPYVLYVGGHEPRKNVAAVFRAMEHYWAEHDEPLELHLTGDRTSLSPDACARFESLADRSRVRFLAPMSDAELGERYAGASALLMLSTDEGFGLPPLEAMAHGCPVVAARNASLPEVVGDAGLLVDAEDAAAVCRALRSFVADGDEREAVIRSGFDRARRFGWDVTAKHIRGIYEEVARHRHRANDAPNRDREEAVFAHETGPLPDGRGSESGF